MRRGKLWRSHRDLIASCTPGCIPQRHHAPFQAGVSSSGSFVGEPLDEIPEHLGLLEQVLALHRDEIVKRR